MKLLFVILFLNFCANFINCWLAKVPYDPEEFARYNISTEDVQCFSKSHGLNSMSIGEVKPLEKTCGKAKCSSDRTIHLTGCGKAKVAPPCHVGPGDLSKPYPECCFEIICP
ncbi:unnamed protein product [Ceutorhynchus assimilis]|uniref:Single domain-containing protein n=1 Tax=Ceutorhynchus assimilis TaxID=467358 RepID=A0A9N9MHB1_9CUCU|nr:unnamed protein product [Ceutorhynchus assimilis]